MQPGGYVGADPWDYWNYLSENYCIIGYIYTPNQQTVREDEQGNTFPTNAEEANSTSVAMTDVSLRLYGDYWIVPQRWNHLFGDPQGGNWMGGDGHVEWKNYSQQVIRVIHGSPPDEWSHERYW